jgi:hypothetical protein
MPKSENAKLGDEFLNLARSALNNAAKSRSPTNAARCIRGAIKVLKLALKEYGKGKETDNGN